MKADRDIKHLYPTFATKVEWIVDMANEFCEVHCPAFRVTVGETLRSRGRQQWLYAQGRSRSGSIVTKLNGNPGQESSHQSGLAVDFWIYVDGPDQDKVADKDDEGNITWKAPWMIYEYIGHLARSQDLVWGGDWDGDQKSSDEKFVDGPHVEWKRKDRFMYEKARKWLRERSLG